MYNLNMSPLLMRNKTSATASTKFVTLLAAKPRHLIVCSYPTSNLLVGTWGSVVVKALRY